MANTNDDDNFGLPEINYRPLDQLKEVEKKIDKGTPPIHETVSSVEESVPTENNFSQEETETPQSVAFEEEPEEEKQTWGLGSWLLIIFVVLAALFSYYQFFYVPKQLAKAKQAQEELQKQEALQKAKQDEELKAAAEKAKQEQQAKVETKPVGGTIETVSARTGQYYVIVCSAIDGELLMDHAKRLSYRGVGTKYILPFGKSQFYRLGINSYDSFASAQTGMNEVKAQYGNDLWILKY